MSLGIYVRVSTTGQYIDSQKREIQRWLEGNGLKEATWFIDKATGTNLARPAFEKLQTAIFNGEIRTVVCGKLDRLSRSLRDGINVFQPNYNEPLTPELSLESILNTVLFFDLLTEELTPEKVRFFRKSQQP